MKDDLAPAGFTEPRRFLTPQRAKPFWLSLALKATTRASVTAFSAIGMRPFPTATVCPEKKTTSIT
jgi:hypothetical protein